MRLLVLALLCAAAAGILSPADAMQRETIGIGSAHYGHDWRKDRDELRGHRSHCRMVWTERDGELKRIKRCY